MQIFISSKDNQRLPKVDLDVFCSCSKRVGAVVADHGDFLHITIHSCKECGDTHESYEDVEFFDMYKNIGKTSFELFEEHKKEWEEEENG